MLTWIGISVAALAAAPVPRIRRSLLTAWRGSLPSCGEPAKKGLEDPGRGSRRGSSDGQVSRRRGGTDSPARALERVPDLES